jgi:hypothetical protein
LNSITLHYHVLIILPECPGVPRGYGTGAMKFTGGSTVYQELRHTAASTTLGSILNSPNAANTTVFTADMICHLLPYSLITVAKRQSFNYLELNMQRLCSQHGRDCAMFLTCLIRYRMRRCWYSVLRGSTAATDTGRKAV